MENKEKEKLKRTSDILLKGGKLLGGACPQCGGLLLLYQGRTVCVNCDNISEIAKIPIVSTVDIARRVENLVSKKIEEVARHLENEGDIKEQTHLAELLLKFMEILSKIQKTKQKSETKNDDKIID
ncbi:MAG: Sjogren's syndrome/scleroderma autoantigen 1 family protein [Nitrososphaerales archaeon]|nr:Sjogren's syndrome/scleroderma autoantigen 1 family protein [Nitrososphaerales archaeon]